MPDLAFPNEEQGGLVQAQMQPLKSVIIDTRNPCSTNESKAKDFAFVGIQGELVDNLII
jgi:hypothetical protein